MFYRHQKKKKNHSTSSITWNENIDSITVCEILRKKTFFKKFSQGSTKIPSYDPSIFLYYYFSFYDFKNNVKIYERDENEKKNLILRKGIVIIWY